MSHKIFRGVALLMALILSLGTVSAQKPKLVINIVVGSMRASDIDRYMDNFSSGGFRRLVNGGYRYTNASYDYAYTNTVAGLATLSTGSIPAVHGVVGDHWWNYVDGTKVALTADSKATSLNPEYSNANYSAHSLVAPTIGDMLIEADSKSKLYTIAIEPNSAIALNGKSGIAIWADDKQAHWITSSAFTSQMPAWIDKYNDEGINKSYTLKRWTPVQDIRRYINNEVAVVEDIKHKSTKLISGVDLKLANDINGKMRYTPAGNQMVMNFAAMLIVKEALGKDTHTDILNIYLDTARNIAESYGPESIEYEDMLYRLDNLLSQFLSYVYSQFNNHKDIVIVLTSDHGTSPSYNPVGESARDRFNPRQMAVLANAYLGAHHGSANYILGVANNAVYLDHNVIAEQGLTLDAVREDVAGFILRMQGVSNAVSATSLRNNSFIEGRNQLMQNSFYPTRSGDVLIDLRPSCIIENDNIRSSSDGGYNYDRNVPLIVYRSGKAHVIKRKVDMTQIAPTIASMLEIESPWASEAEPLEEF
ncbi:MAG: alkaline phosphatase family protein [Alistipes sp.]|nr:alkaline phosphatase family protein [Alistipes sp.]